ncbi:M23 family metallopeptidase [Sporichthya sp.]|uniref:M23 family metallopeptidase n=1 Tax=Sporichthya sp. TaxID=65475 RepID=UPI0017F9FAE4|nr:M23 family metallopeptidase [Sporichthya sp.]MBA3745207.1 M23 family metallopeptidase [Sporichthya sp.]
MKRALILGAVLAALAGCSGGAAEERIDPDPPLSAQGTIDAFPSSTARPSPTVVPPPKRTATPLGKAIRPSASPLSAALVTVFPIAGCKASYGRTHHDYPASDIFADEGCSVVSVTSGLVDEVSRRDTWSSKENDGATRGGLSVSVVGQDGVRYYYSHLSVIAAGIEPGRSVISGQQLGEVGKTGSARSTSPHLHFGLSWPTPMGAWWIRRGMLAPAPYLDAWRSGRYRSPANEIESLRKKLGDSAKCEAAC